MTRLIDADALKRALEIESYNDYDDLLRTERLIDNAPTIKAFTLADIEEQYRKGIEKGLEEARPHGEWIQDFTMDTSTICSKCGEKVWYKEYSGWVTESNFCPNCGADMRKKEGETETWNGFHGQLEVPKGTFDKIWNDEEGEAE